MRFNKTIFVLLLAASLGPSLAWQPAQANPHHWSDAGNQSGQKNEGRKLSMTVPGLGTASLTVTPASAKTLVFGKPLAPGRHLTLGQPDGKQDLSIETSGSNVTVRVPPSIDAAIDDAQVVARQMSKAASKSLAGASRFIDVIVLYFKQWTGTTTITPGGYPYAEKSSSLPAFCQPPTAIASGNKLYFTGEGRLKSVVNR